MLIKLKKKYRTHVIDGGGRPKRAKGGSTTHKKDNNPGNNPQVVKKHSILWHLNKTAKSIVRIAA